MTGTTASPTELTLAVGETVSFHYGVLPASATNTAVSVTIRDTAIATLTADEATRTAAITGVAAGTTSATVRTPDRAFETSIAVTVTDPAAG